MRDTTYSETVLRRWEAIAEAMAQLPPQRTAKLWRAYRLVCFWLFGQGNYCLRVGRWGGRKVERRIERGIAAPGATGVLSPQLMAPATVGLDRLFGLFRLIVALLVLTTVLLEGYNLPAATVGNGEVVSPSGEIYENATAEKLVQEARKYDPMFCPEEQRDRDKAVFWYKQAIDAQPGAKVNAVLADRIAQLYAFYADRKNKVAPVRDNARHWWTRCVDSTNPKQLLWAQAQMGLANVAADAKAATVACDNIKKLDASQIELDNWKAWPEGDSDRAKAIREREKEQLRKRVEEIQNRAAKKKAHIEEQAKLIERRKAAEAIPHQETKPSRWNYKKSLMVLLWAGLVAAFVGRRVVNRINYSKYS